MKKRIFRICLVILFLAPFFLQSQPKEKKFNKSEELRREIRLVNLINGLELNSEQMEMILSRAREVEKLRQEFEARLQFRQAEMERVLEEIKSYRKHNQEVPSTTAQSFHHLQTEFKESRLNLMEKTREYAKEIEKTLEEHQVYQLQEFIPCIIPPKGELRIGQTQDHKGLTRGIERIRELPCRFYARKKDQIIERTLARMKLHAPPRVEIDEKEMKKHIGFVLEKARSLKDIEFDLQKDELAAELIAPLKPQTLSSNSPLSRKIEAFLLSPEIIPLIEERLESGK
ncbi:MAG: hypothetical protein GTO17_08120 [Candidatus Aminicenantes bacterium]|nr:hypothetical protein [Candidatus Aminicenantes bacterium]